MLKDYTISVALVYGVTMSKQDSVAAAEKRIPLGRYRHFKGSEYSVVGFARHSETRETMVLYVPLYGEGGYWVRPLDMFTELVERDGKQIPRFSYIDD